MKFRHVVRFTRSCYLTVDYHVYRMPRAHFSHFSFITEVDYSLVLILPRFALSKLRSERCMILLSHKCSMVVEKILNTLIRQSFSSSNREN